MANFTASFTRASGNLCQRLIVTDTSNYGNNDQGIDKGDFYARTVTVRNILGQNIANPKTIPANSDSVEFDVDLVSGLVYLYVELNLIGVNNGYTVGVGNVVPCII